MTFENIIVAIDGPAGSGKSTVAKLVAKKLEFLYIDTGAMYRALTVKVKRNDIAPTDQTRVCAIMKETTIQLRTENDTLKVLLDSKDVSREIRKPYISDGVSEIAKIKSVRELMTQLQRTFAKNNSCVLEGRDIGTVVFPNAQFKFYIDAAFKERAERRFKELKEKKETITLDFVKKDLSNRDSIDSTRECAPLKQAKDAIYINTTTLTIDEVVDKIISYIKDSKRCAHE